MVTVLHDKKAIVLNLSDPKKVTTIIPTAKLVKHKNSILVAVPHRPDETRVLRLLGFEVPDPMKEYYDFPPAAGIHKPFAAQIETSSFASMQSRCFILNSMGTGKTLASLWAYDYMRTLSQVNKVLIVCPLSTMERTWADEVFKTFPWLTATVVYGTRERRQKLLAQESHIYIVNTDGVKVIQDDLAERPDIDLVIVDEVAMFRNASTDRWKSMNMVLNKQTPRRVWALTGMPTPNSPTDAWAQCRLVDPTNEEVPKYFSKARDELMRQLTQFKWAPREDCNETIMRWMQPSIRFSLDDCVDLPEQIFVQRDAEMTAEQKKAYKEMMLKLSAEYQGGQILAVNEAVKTNKLIQIACGVAYAPGGEEIVIPAKHRLETVIELVEESEGKVIVFVPLTSVLEQVAATLSKHWEVEIIHGNTPKNKRDEIFQAFQSTPSPHVLVANPGTMSHGLTLTAATTVVWYAPIHSNDIYEQACARVRRPGQKRTTVIAHVAGSEIERRIYERLATKQKLQGLLLEMMQGR
jgi:SNF2 family DNA or RNA helicase